jgi:hypothetical protein
VDAEEKKEGGMSPEQAAVLLEEDSRYVDEKGSWGVIACEGDE